MLNLFSSITEIEFYIFFFLPFFNKCDLRTIGTKGPSNPDDSSPATEKEFSHSATAECVLSLPTFLFAPTRLGSRPNDKRAFFYSLTHFRFCGAEKGACLSWSKRYAYERELLQPTFSVNTALSVLKMMLIQQAVADMWRGSKDEKFYDDYLGKFIKLLIHFIHLKLSTKERSDSDIDKVA